VLDWISRNSEVLNVILSAGMLVIWMTYLHVFVSSYRRQTRPGILINMGAGEGIESRCLVSNMSSGPIYLLSIALDLEMPEGRLRCPVTELDGMEEWEICPPRSTSGPVRGRSIQAAFATWGRSGC